MLISRKAILLSSLFSLAIPATSAFAQEAGPGYQNNEIVVTARLRQETLADVPVTVTVFSEEDLSRYATRDIQSLATQIPNAVVGQTGLGSGVAIYLRGVGSSFSSGAFDQSVAFNIDGVVANIGRLIQVGYLDLGSTEVLKGPQSLYFGKSTTAGVFSLTSKDPGTSAEFSARAAYEFEHREPSVELIASGPLSDTFGARLAVSYAKAKRVTINTAPVSDRNVGEETINGRVTLKWNPSSQFEAKLKVALSKYKNDNPFYTRERICADPAAGSQPTAIPSPLAPGLVLPGAPDDCKLNGKISMLDSPTAITRGMTRAEDGIPFTDTDAIMGSLQLRWNPTDNLTLKSITGFAKVDNVAFIGSDMNAGFFAGQQRELKRSFSQELILTSDFDGPFNFTTGAYFADSRHFSDNFQSALGLGFLVGPDPVTGNGFEWRKKHETDGKTYSAFFAGSFDLMKDFELSGGVRYTKETKKGSISIPYLSTFLKFAPPFDNVPSQINGLRFKDDNWSPEVAINWKASDSISIFASYKKAFKSGGIDTSALPTNSLSAPISVVNDALTFGSEQAEGFEVGIKTQLLDRSLAFNASAFTYRYKDLQAQQFDFINFQYVTTNASLVTVK